MCATRAYPELGVVEQQCREVFVEMADPSILAAYLYGSLVSGNWRQDSDLDVAVLDAADSRLTWAGESKLMDELEKATGLQVDLRLLRDCCLSHQLHILENGRLAYLQGREDLSLFREEVIRRFRLEKPASRETWRSLVTRLARRPEAPR